MAESWRARQGNTNGVGFPYANSWGNASAAVTAAMAPYSWQTHLIDRGVYSDWVGLKVGRGAAAELADRAVRAEAGST